MVHEVSFCIKFLHISSLKFCNIMQTPRLKKFALFMQNDSHRRCARILAGRRTMSERNSHSPHDSCGDSSKNPKAEEASDYSDTQQLGSATPEGSQDWAHLPIDPTDPEYEMRLKEISPLAWALLQFARDRERTAAEGVPSDN